MKADSARLFFALWPGNGLLQSIGSLQKKLSAQGRAIDLSMLHMTLVFLGQVHPDRIPGIRAAADEMVFVSTALVLDRLGYFPRARVGWLGPGRVPRSLQSFVSGMAVKMAELGLHPDARAWKPHITLYRDLRMPFAKMEFEAMTWTPESYCLVHSHHDGNRLMYEKLGHWPTG